MYQQTSLLAYRSIQNSLNDKQKEVLRVIQEATSQSGLAITDLEISKLLVWPINRVTPRRGELEQKNMIFAQKLVKNPSGRVAKAYFPLKIWTQNSV